MAAKTPDGDEAGGVKSGGHAGGKSRNATPPAIGEYISDYLKAASRNDLHNQLQFYADRVNYFHNGKLDRRIVEKVLLAYQERWQKRRYVLVGAVMYRKLPSTGEMSVQYRVNFVLKKDRVVVKGQTTNYVVIDAATADPRIIDIQEERVRN